jgi:hypothetical protein
LEIKLELRKNVSTIDKISLLVRQHYTRINLPSISIGHLGNEHGRLDQPIEKMGRSATDVLFRVGLKRCNSHVFEQPNI